MTVEPTALGGYTPICNNCGVALCQDISQDEYTEARGFWDIWECKECNDGPMSLREWLAARRAHLTDIIMDDEVQCVLHRNIPVKYLHSYSKLSQSVYYFAGEIWLENVLQGDILCTIDAFAYRARKTSTGEIKHIKNGTYNDGLTGRQHSLKLIGVLREGRLYIVVKPAGERICDIAPLAPVRASGMSQMYNMRRKRFSSSETHKQSA